MQHAPVWAVARGATNRFRVFRINPETKDWIQDENWYDRASALHDEKKERDVKAFDSNKRKLDEGPDPIALKKAILEKYDVVGLTPSGVGPGSQIDSIRLKDALGGRFGSLPTLEFNRLWRGRSQTKLFATSLWRHPI